MMRCFIFAIAIGVLALPRPGIGQERHDLDERTCRECRIELQRVVTIGEKDGQAALPGALSQIARAADGTYYLTTSNDPGRVMVFSRTGKFLRRIGREGRGPGEFAGISNIIAGPDALHVLDNGNLRQTRLRYASDDLLENTPIPAAAGDAILLGDGSLVIAAPIPVGSSGGHTIHVVDDAGKVVRRLGMSNGPFRLDRPFALDRELAAAQAPDMIWAAFRTEYRLQQWDLVSGELTAEIVREPTWFPSYEKWQGFRSDVPPHPLIMDLGIDGEYLWTLTFVADEAWKESLVPVRDAHGERFVPGDLQRYFDTVVEVIDLRGPTLLVTSRTDRPLGHYLGEGYVAASREDEDGYPFVDIWRLRLRQ